MKPLERQLKQYLKYCEETRNMQPATLRNKRTTLRELSEFLAGRHISDINEMGDKDIQDWIGTFRKRNLMPRTVNCKLKHLKLIVSWLRDMGEPVPNVHLSYIVKDRETEPERVFYSRKQIDEALSFADRREWLLIMLCFDCGLRISEARTLRLCNIRGDRLTILGKGRKRDFVYMRPELQCRLADWIKREKITDYLFEGQNKKPICYSSCREAMRKPFMQAGLYDFHPHALRHSCASEVVNCGNSMEDAQIILRHNSVKTTQEYVHQFGGSRKVFQRCRWIKDEKLR